MEEHPIPERTPTQGEDRIILEDPRISASEKKAASAKSKKESAAAAASAKESADTGSAGNESNILKARKRTKTGCLSIPFLTLLHSMTGLTSVSVPKAQDQVW